MSTKISSVKNQTTNSLLWNAYDGNPFNDEGIAKIVDNMDNVEIPVTSIPSPYAQMHLFSTAFADINKKYEKADKNQEDVKKVLSSTSTYHRAISDCLDIFELLYSYDILSLGDKISIRTWGTEELKRLKESNHKGQQTFAETLEVYGNNYSEDARFNSIGTGIDAKKAFDQFILIFFNDKILAAGSPLTGFFFNREKDAPKIKKHNGKEFFSGVIPLYKRDLEFQIFLSIFFGGSPDAIKAFPELNKYRENNNKVRKSEKLNNIINKIENKGEVPEEYKEQFSLLNISNSPIYLLGELERTQYKYKPVLVAEKKGMASGSDYVIRTSKSLSNPPLVLIENSKKKHWKFLDGPLDENLDLKKDLTVEIEKRNLPGTSINYPYLQQEDLFTDHLIQLRYDVNEERFWAFGDQNFDTSEVKNVLLPIKQEYFKYFTFKDLKEQLFIERLNNGSVVVKLSIPVQGDNGKGVVTFDKTYLKSLHPEKMDISKDKGAIINSSLGFGIYPFFKVDVNKYNDQYKILQFCGEDEEVNCSFLREDSTSNKTISVNCKHEFIRTRKEEAQHYVSKYTELSVFNYDDENGTTINEENITFDLVAVKITNSSNSIVAQGFIFPIFNKVATKIVEKTNSIVAFDIGTSSSHVMCATSEENLFELDTYNEATKAEGLHLVFLHKPEYDFKGSDKFNFNSKNIFGLALPQLAEFLPALIGSKSNYTFPIPTVINQDNDAEPTERKDLSVLSNVNIPFAYGQQPLRTNPGQGTVLDNLYSNLKWDVSKIGNEPAKHRLYLFIDQLAWMTRNKIISKGLDPSQTEIIWFKPLSMGTDQRNAFNEIWNEVYCKYFGKEKTTTKIDKITSVTESWAPFFSQEQAFGSGEVYMNIDIGGGTTDILLFKDSKPSLTTSFRFAGNALFDGGLKRGNGKDNGFYTKYKDFMLKEFAGNSKVKDIIKGITDSDGLRSTDLISYFFRLKEFRDNLQLDGEFQLLFLLHNAAIFYHAAQLVNVAGYNTPNKIGLSGNGARLISITNRDTDLNRFNGMSELVAKIFEYVFDFKDEVTNVDENNIELEILDNPKNATAEGGIKGLATIKNQKDMDVRNFNIGLGDKNTLLKGKRQKDAYGYTKMRTTESPEIENVVSNVYAFLDLFFNELWFDVDFTDSYGLAKTFNREKLKTYFCNKQRIRSSIRTAINNKIDQEGIDELSETLFFYPIMEYIFQFSKILANSSELSKFKN